MRDYKKYDIWKLSHLLTLEVYKITESFPKEEIFGLTSQIRRASSSIGINIVEGCGRGSDEDFKRFLRNASGSAFEVEYTFALKRFELYIRREIYRINSKSRRIKNENLKTNSQN